MSCAPTAMPVPSTASSAFCKNGIGRNMTISGGVAMVRTFDASNASSASASCAVDGFSFQLPAMSARRCGWASYQTLLSRRVDGARTVLRGATNAWLDASASAAASICMMDRAPRAPHLHGLSCNLQTTRRVRNRRANSSAPAAQQCKGILRVALRSNAGPCEGDSLNALCAAESNQLHGLEAPRNRIPSLNLAVPTDLVPSLATHDGFTHVTACGASQHHAPSSSAHHCHSGRVGAARRQWTAGCAPHRRL